MPLSRVVADVIPPPELWNRIAASTSPALMMPPPPHRALRAWQASTAVALALAAGLAAFIIWRGPAPTRLALLTPTGGQPSLVAVQQGGTLLIRPAAALPVPSGRDLELWALPSGAVRPRSLGVLPASGRRLGATLAPGTRILVSLEPTGGSPTGLPTGPVVYAGQLQRFNP